MVRGVLMYIKESGQAISIKTFSSRGVILIHDGMLIDRRNESCELQASGLPAEEKSICFSSEKHRPDFIKQYGKEKCSSPLFLYIGSVSGRRVSEREESMGLPQNDDSPFRDRPA